MSLPPDYAQRVYAGVLGKLIGVYLGRPIEGWKYRDIVKTFGTVDYYVHDRRGVELVVADDDITGTFTFVRALEDHAESGADLSAEQIGRTWLNYIIENKTILWWGGLGQSTEHTAFLRLKHGIPAPHSGSIALNGRIAAEQIGAQIFIDGWAMAAPGDPDLATRLARRAASVSHDGEAVNAAVLLAAMEAQAFVEPDLGKLLDLGVGYVPADSVIRRLVDDLREFRAKEPDWQKAMTGLVEPRYGYDTFGGNCHVVPNHALILLALLWSDDDFGKSLMIVNTCGWDTDCNSGNVGCFLGIKNGLAGIDAGPRDWRGPVADRLYLPTADAGACMSDAVTVALGIENLGRRLAGEPPRRPKDGAKFHFTMPGSVQGWTADPAAESRETTIVEHDRGRLAIRYRELAAGRVARAQVATFLHPDQFKGRDTYRLVCSPTLYPTQRLYASLQADVSNDRAVTARPYVRHYIANDELAYRYGPEIALPPGGARELRWTVPDTGNYPIADVGIEVAGSGGATGTIFLDRLDWRGTPTITLARPENAGTGSAWSHAWAEAVDRVGTADAHHPFRFIQNVGRGLYLHGTRDWTNYTVTTTFTPMLASAIGIAARAGGMKRYYALLLATSDAGRRVVRLVKVRDAEQVLAEAPFDWTFGDGREYRMSLSVTGSTIAGTVDDQPPLAATDSHLPIESGATGFVIEEGHGIATPIDVRAL